MKRTGRKRYWPDGHQQRAKCPKCGKIGLRSLVVLAKGRPACWEFRHGRVPGPLDDMGVPRVALCFVGFDVIPYK